MTEQPTKTGASLTSNAPQDEPIIVWQAKEFTEYERDHRWYVGAGIVGGLLVVASLFLHQWLAAVVFVLATFVVLKHADDQPRTLTYTIGNLGITTGEKFRPYNELRSFGIIYKPPVKTLTIQTTSRFKPLIKIHLADLDPTAVREALKNYLPEQPKETEDFLDKFSRFIRL